MKWIKGEFFGMEWLVGKKINEIDFIFCEYMKVF